MVNSALKDAGIIIYSQKGIKLGDKLYSCICEVCGKQFKSTSNKGKYCSDECKIKALYTQVECSNCGKLFLAQNRYIKDYNEGKRRGLYCSRQCVNQSNRNSVTKVCEYCGKEFTSYESYSDKKFCSRECYQESRRNYKKCPVCNKIFIASRKDQIYCSNECKAKSMQDRIKCKCDFCGKQFQRKRSQVIKNKRHYCSIQCKKADLQWNEQQQNLLIQNFDDMTYQELSTLFQRWDYDSIKRKAQVLGLTSNKQNRLQYIQLAEYLRRKISPIVQRYKKDKKYTCELTGIQGNIVFHHITSFNILLKRAFQESGLSHKESIDQYSQQQLDKLTDIFIRIHQQKKQYIVINQNIHRKFHGIYGYGNNTIDQWNEFVKNRINNNL